MLATKTGNLANDNIHIVEFKYCRDTDHAPQLQHCLEQHKTLVEALIHKGYSPQNIKVVPILIGMSGTIYLKHTLENMQSLGISQPHAMKCALKMHTQAITSLHSIVSVRRHLEHAPQHNINGHRQTQPHRPRGEPP